MKMLIYAFIFFGSVGLGLEVVFTALGAHPKDRVHLFGFSSLYYIPIYGILIPLFFFYSFPYLRDYSFIVRGLIYVPIFHFGEFVTMGILRLLNGSSPSEESYYKSKWNIKGLTRLDYAPAMFILSLLMEALFILIFDK